MSEQNEQAHFKGLIFLQSSHREDETRVIQTDIKHKHWRKQSKEILNV